MVRGLFFLTALACSGTALAKSDCTMVTKDTKAEADGHFLPGKFGAWGTPVPVTSGATAPADGAWCAGCSMVKQGAKAPDAGSFYTGDGAKVQMVKKDAEAGEEGLYCKGGSGEVPWETNLDCTMVTKDTKAEADGHFLPGKFGAWGTPVPVTSGATAPADGAWCAGCSMVKKGAKAPDAGSYYTGDGAKVQMVKKDAEAGEEGLYCKGGSGKVPWLKTEKTAATTATTATNASTNATSAEGQANDTKYPYSFSMMLFSALAYVMSV